MKPTPRRLTDPRELRAVSHPVRLAILEHLTVEGPMTATALGTRIGESPANCSWHLRKLAEHGFVEEAPGGTGRQRPWRAASRGMRWNDVDDSPELQRAGDALSQVLVEREVARLAEWRARGHLEDPAWREAATANQSMLWLTADELAEINEAIRGLLTSRMERHDDPGARPEGARLCALMAWGVPAYGFGETGGGEDA
jgi:predicted ArsR family transcriptional regulator